MGDRVSVWEMESSGSGWRDGYATVGVHSMTLNCILKDGQDSEFSMYFITIKIIEKI